MLSRRNLVLMVALIATTAASVIDFEFTEQTPPAHGGPPSVAAVKVEPPTSHPSVEGSVAMAGVGVRFGKQATNLFAAHSWQPPPPKPVQQKAADPKAPPLPFRYVGKMLEQGSVVAFIAQDARTFLARKGDVLLNYRIESVTPTQMTFVFLPLDETQTLSFGSSN